MWDNLPAELKIEILKHVIAQQPDTLAQYATVCRVWQNIIEPILFAEVTLYVTNESISSGVTTPSTLTKHISGPRKRELKRLRLVIDFLPLGIAGTAYASSAFVDIIDSFVNTLSKWKYLSFDLEIHERIPCARYLLHGGSNFLQRPKKSIECVRSIRHLEFNADRCKHCSYKGLLSLLCSRMSDNLTEIQYGFDQKYPTAAPIYGEECNFVPTSVKSLTIRNMNQTAFLPWSNLLMTEALESVSTQLETLHVSHYVDAEALFVSFQSGIRSDPPRWPKLRRLSITFSRFRRSVPYHFGQGPMGWIAMAALQMPRLQRLDVWFPKINHPYGCFFRYWIQGGRSHVLWDTGRGNEMPLDLFNKWDAVARFHTSRSLDTDIRTMNSAEAGDGDPLKASLSFFEPFVPSADYLVTQSPGV